MKPVLDHYGIPELQQKARKLLAEIDAAKDGGTIGRDEAARLAKLKAKMIQQINAAKPWLREATVGDKKIGLQITKADDSGITLRDAGTRGEKTEQRTWTKVDDALLQLIFTKAKVVGKDAAADHLAAAILFRDRKNIKVAKQYFAKARKLGAKIEPHLDLLAEAEYADIKKLLDKGEFAKARTDLAEFEKFYAGTTWLASHAKELAAANGRIANAEAEKVYLEAKALYEKKELWDLKLRVEKLKRDYPKTPAVTDTKRKPSYADFVKAIAALGKKLTVRQDGKGDHKSIQAAIDAAPINSLIEIQDDGPYNEKLVFPKEKPGLTLRGKKGCWPLITQGKRKDVDVLVTIGASPTTLRRVLLVHSAFPPTTESVHCVLSGMRSLLQLRSVFVYMKGSSPWHHPVHPAYAGLIIEDSVVAAYHKTGGVISVSNSLWLVGYIHTTTARLRSCTIPATVGVTHSSLVTDCIVGQYNGRGNRGNRMTYCNLFGKNPIGDAAKPGEGCFRKNPMFRDPRNLDFRLSDKSPGRGKASDGGDIGVRFTPEMLEMLKRIRELRKKGIVKF